MNQTLRDELTKYFSLIKKREEELKIENEDKESFELDTQYFEQKLHTIAIGILRDMKWNFEKDRVRGDALKINNNMLERRMYRCHRFYRISCFELKNYIDNDKFREMLKEIGKLVEDNKITGENNSYYGPISHQYTRYEKEKDEKFDIKLDCNIPISFLKTWKWEIGDDVLNSILVNQFEGEIKLICKTENPSLKDVLAIDEVYEKAKELYGLFMEAKKKRKIKLDRLLEEVDKIITKYGFMEYVVLEGI